MVRVMAFVVTLLNVKKERAREKGDRANRKASHTELGGQRGN